MSITHPTNTGPVSEGLDQAALLGLYEQMVLVRQTELIVQKLYRDGELPGFIHLYIGQEATGVGVIAQLRPDDWITSTHRGHGHALAKGVSPKILLAELAGKATGCCGGRGGTMHLYSPSVGLFGTNGLVGGGIPAAVGLGLSAMTRGTDQVAVAFFGDGASNHGAFHESVNLAGIQNAPVVFVCENNLYATATPLTMATRNVDIASKGAAHGVPGVSVDGNDVLAVWEVAGEAVRRARAGEGPTLIESRTYRMVGHHEGDQLVGTYRTQEEMDSWASRCPILRFRGLLVETGQASAEELDAVDARIAQQLTEAVDFARSSPAPDPATATHHTWAEPVSPPGPGPAAAGEEETVVRGWMESVCDGIAEEMRRDPHILYLGEGIGERGGTFGHSKGLYEEFGPRRLIDTPICELGFTGASIGASGTGCRTIADLMISDFLWEAGSQIVLQAARLRYMSNGEIGVPMVVRSGMGTVKNAGPHHSGTFHAVWAHCPGLIVVVPSNPADAKGLFKTALRGSDPVIFLEHKSLLSSKGPVPVGEHFVPFGQASVVREGSDLTIVSCGLWLHRSMDAARRLAEENIACDVIDLRTIVPLDVETIVASVAKTGRILVVDEGHAMCGLGAEIAAVVMEHAFDDLDAPVGRLHPDPVPTPFSPVLEDTVMASADRIVSAARAVLEGRPIAPLRAQGSPRSAASAPQDRSHVQTKPEIVQTPSPDAVPPTTSDAAPFVVPNMDLTITEVTVLRWLKKIGDTIGAGEGVVEVETDKAVLEIESPIDGTLVEILTDQGSTVPLGGELGTIKPN